MGVMQHNFGVAASQANMHSFHEAWIHNNDNVGLFTDAGEEEKKLLEFARRKQRAEKRAEAFMIKADASLSTPAQVLFFATLSDEKVPSLAAPCHTIPVQLRIAEDSDIIAVEVSCDCVAVARKSAVGDMLKGGAISKSFGRAEMDYDRGCFAVRVAHDGGSASGDAFSEGTWAVKWRVSVAREASQHALWSSWSTPADVQVVDRAVEGRDRLREQLRAECDAGAAALSRVVRAATRLGMRVEKKELMHALQFCRKSAEKLQAHKLDGAAADVAAAAAKAVSTARKAVSSAAPALEALEKRDAAEKSRQQRASFLAVLAHKRDAGTMEKWVQKVKDADLAALAGDANRLFQCLCEDKWPARVLAAAAARNDLFSHRNLKKLRDLADLAQTLLDKEAEKAARESKRQAALLANFTARDWQAEETARRKTCDALAVAAAKAREAEAEKLRIAEALRLAVPDAAALAAAPAFYETAQAAARRGEMMLKDEALARELHQLELMEEQMDPSRHFRLTDDGENADAPEDEYDITCPIRRTLFLDPVVLQGDGQAYEREAIEKWLLAHRTSPYSGARLPPGGERLTPNPALQRKADAARRRAQPPRNAQPPPGRDAQLWQWQQQTEERQQAAEAQQRLARHEDQRRRERQQEVRQPWPQQWQPTPAPRPRAAAPAPARPPPQRAPSAAPRPAAAPRQASPLASELEQFLGTLDLEQESLAGLRLSLVENEIFDSQTLAFLSDEDMKEIGIKLGTKKKIIRHLPAWRAQA
ncbi:hypothetical protein M885DRAFT_241868 [Pelagophyceae sp. CCMP2097]|nr:hypothetical protein M885DRAFT_241868 [Pelagophyceae sp. CCMP2097]